MVALRCSSLRAVGSDAATSLCEQLRRLDRPLSAVLWMGNSSAPDAVAESLSESLPACSVASLRGV